jgi:16S rRNA (cytidine1402-2'-O)-methyltransferase
LVQFAAEPMPGILYVVATPIGNLEDVTLRALRVLREVSLIAAEDTRRTARLLQHYSIPTPTTSLHEHNERARTPGLIRRLQEGDSLALVTDAGTPVLSDPGALLVTAAHEAGIRVEPVPGPSAVMAALSGSGLHLSDGFLFAGFAPFRSEARKRFLERVSGENRPVVLFEAPHRVRALLAEMLATLGDRRITIARELTKVHEELVISPISAYLTALKEPVGEYTIVIHKTEAAASPSGSVPAERLVEEFGLLTNSGAVSRKEAIKHVARQHGVSARTVYAAVEAAKRSGE